MAAEGKVEELSNELIRRRASKSKIEAELRNEMSRSESLAMELKRVKAEIAESGSEINETTKALSDTKKELARLREHCRHHHSSTNKADELARERDNAESRAAELAKSLVALNDKLEEKSKTSVSLCRCAIEDNRSVLIPHLFYCCVSCKAEHFSSRKWKRRTKQHVSSNPRIAPWTGNVNDYAITSVD